MAHADWREFGFRELWAMAAGAMDHSVLVASAMAGKIRNPYDPEEPKQKTALADTEFFKAFYKG